MDREKFLQAIDQYETVRELESAKSHLDKMFNYSKPNMDDFLWISEKLKYLSKDRQQSILNFIYNQLRQEIDEKNEEIDEMLKE